MKQRNMIITHFMLHCVSVFLGIATWNTFNSGWQIVMTTLAITAGWITTCCAMTAYAEKFGNEKAHRALEEDWYDD